jgi:hypothetical protein
MVADNSPLFEIAPGEVMHFEDKDTTLRINLSPVPTKRDNLVGFPGMRFQPSLIEAPSARYATTAFSWLNSQTSGIMNRATKPAMTRYYLSSLRAGFNFAPMIPMQLASRLYALSQGDADVHEKLSELTKHLRGIVRRNDEMALGASYNSSWGIFGAFNSEAKVGRLLQERLRREVVLGIRPDIMMDDVGIEVKNILWSFRGEPTLERLCLRAQQVSREQNAQIVVFDLGQYFNFFGHDAMEPFTRVMKHAMWRAHRKKEVSAILLSDSPFERTPRALML